MAKEMVSRKKAMAGKALADRLRQIRLFATDVDGVLTDAGMYYAESGDEWKKFNTRDRMGNKLLQKAGFITAIVTQDHVTRGWALANVLAALNAGITHYESTLGGIGGQPANFVDGVPVAGTGKYYYEDPSITGLVCTEDMVVMMDQMGIDTGLDVDKVLETGRMVERIVGRRLRSESAHTARIPKSLTGRL